jgi:hypothetical protein
LVENEIEEIEVRFVGVCGCITVWVEGWGAANTAGLKVKGSKIGQGEMKV